VGGIKEKVLAAKRAGVTDVILPAENKTNVDEDLTPEQLANLTVHYVKTIEEALRVSLPDLAEVVAKTPLPTPAKGSKPGSKPDYTPAQPNQSPAVARDKVVTTQA